MELSLSELNALVSVVVPTHNRPQLLRRAIDSLVTQTHENLDIIVVDDGSRCDVGGILKSFNDLRITFIRNETPRGACRARNIGIDAAKGQFITFLDDDDEFLPHRIERLLDAWDPERAFIGTGRYRISKFGLKRKMLPKQEITLNDILFKITIGNSVFTRTERVRYLGGFDESLTSSQDYDLWVRLIDKYGSARIIQEPLYVIHTEHESPRISGSRGKVGGHWRFYQKHKSKMSKDQIRSKLFELYLYKGRRLPLKKVVYFGAGRTKGDLVRMYVKPRLAVIKKFMSRVR